MYWTIHFDWGNTVCWTTYFAALLTPIVGITTVLIALQQWRTNRKIQETNEKRLKHERYEKRFAVYDSARTFLREIMINGKDISRGDDQRVLEWYKSRHVFY